MQNILADGLLQSGFSKNEIQNLTEKMNIYTSELLLFNSAYNLVNTDNRNEIEIRHILDSLAAVPCIKKFASEKHEPLIADIGSGGGFPGIPLAVAFPYYHFVLIERMNKRCAFLENCVAMLKLKNVTIENSEVEHVRKNQVDIATFRAFRPLDTTMINTLLALLKDDGTLIAYKAKKEKIIQEMTAISTIVPHYTIVPLEVPFLTANTTDVRERNLVIIRKTDNQRNTLANAES